MENSKINGIPEDNSDNESNQENINIRQKLINYLLIMKKDMLK